MSAACRRLNGLKVAPTNQPTQQQHSTAQHSTAQPTKLQKCNFAAFIHSLSFTFNFATFHLSIREFAGFHTLAGCLCSLSLCLCSRFAVCGLRFAVCGVRPHSTFPTSQLCLQRSKLRRLPTDRPTARTTPRTNGGSTLQGRVEGYSESRRRCTMP